jgi:hypothetical protein
MAIKTDEKARKCAVRNGEVAGAILAESTNVSLVGRCDSPPIVNYKFSPAS